jgi:signal transduction histidine kinase
LVLVVDDIAENRLLAKAALERAGYGVLLAAGGEEALRRFSESMPDLVLLDIMMPGMDGFETCRRLRELPGGADTAVVFLTAMSDAGALEQAMEVAADDFLTKPFNRTELLIRVRSLLRIRELNQELRRHYEVIRTQRDALAQAEEQRKKLLGVIVHDLKNPLAAVVTNIQFVQAAQLDADSSDALTDALASSRSLLRMISNLLDISRAEDGALTPGLDHVDVGAMLEEVRKAIAPRAEGAKVRLEVACAGAGLLVTDGQMLGRVLENLLDNAIRNSPAGGLIRVSAEEDGSGNIRLAVSDQGRAIPPELRERIFEQFAQVDRPDEHLARTSRGLGLPFCKVAVHALGGCIRIEDGPSGGNTICVELPRAAAAGLDARRMLAWPESPTRH